VLLYVVFDNRVHGGETRLVAEMFVDTLGGRIVLMAANAGI